jgi:hypothetical protein
MPRRQERQPESLVGQSRIHLDPPVAGHS